MVGRKENRGSQTQGHTWYMSIHCNNQSYLFLILKYLLMYFQTVYKYIFVNKLRFIYRSKTFYCCLKP